MKSVKTLVIALACLVTTAAAAYASGDSLTIKTLANVRDTATFTGSKIINELKPGVKVLATAIDESGDWLNTKFGWIHRSNFVEAVTTTRLPTTAMRWKHNGKFVASGNGKDPSRNGDAKKYSLKVAGPE